jgi:uncharacterized YigZ family protein
VLSLDEYLVPTGYGEAEFIEKKSRFIGHVWCVESEEEALSKIQEMKKQHYDASHNCWAYVLRDGAMRFSDDGEPGGTAGNPMMQVLQREQLYNVVCVVTRYFGGILLGAGGLVRAYTKGAKIAIDAAGKSMKRVWTVLYVPCPYTYYERMKLEVEAFGGVIRKTDFGSEVELEILVAQPKTQAFLEKLTDMTAGTVDALEIAQEYRAFPVTGEES